MMNNINYQNLNTNTQNINPELRKRLDENQENYTALDKEQIKGDAVQLANKAKENLQENFAFRFLRGIGVKNPKKFTSITLAIATVIGMAFAGNKLAAPSAKLGEAIDGVLLNKSNVLGKIYGNISDFLSNTKKGITNQLTKIPVFADIKDTMQNRKLSMQANCFRGYERGPVGIFIMTLNDIMERSVFGTRKADVSSICSSLGIKTDGALPDISEIMNKAQAKLATLTEAKEIDDYKEAIRQAAAKLNSIQSEDAAKFDAIKKLVGDSNAKKYFDGLAKGMKSNQEQKFYAEFINAVVDNLQNTCPQLQNKTKAEILTLAKNNKLVNFGGPDVSQFIGIRMGKPAQTLSQRFTNFSTSAVNGFKNLPAAIINAVHHPLQTGGKVIGILGGKFTQGISNWWPATVIEDAGRMIPGNKDWEFCRGNLFDSLIKFDAMNGTGAKTLPGKVVQKLPILFTEGVSNFVNDKSGLGVFLALNLVGLFDTIQEAPDDKKVSTILENFVNQNAGWALQNPVTYSIIYNAATLKNLQGTGFGSKLLRIPGRIFGLGLGANNGPGGKLKGIIGGGLRFFLWQNVIFPKVAKVIDKTTKKIFNPYDPQAAAQQKAFEEQKNTLIPELGVTQGELLEKIQKNPQAFQKLQNNPELLKILDANPKLLIDYLDGKDITKISQTSSQKPAMTLSPSLANRINQRKQNNLNTNPAQQQIPQGNAQASQTPAPAAQNKNVDTATYIPSSQFVANSSTLSEEQSARYNEKMTAADKALKRAEKYI